MIEEVYLIYLNNNCWNSDILDGVFHITLLFLDHMYGVSVMFLNFLLSFFLLEGRDMNYKFQVPDPYFKPSCIRNIQNWGFCFGSFLITLNNIGLASSP